MTDYKTSPFLAAHLRRLADCISLQTNEVLKQRGINIDSKTVSVIFVVSARRGISVSEVAATLSASHQLITQRVAKLIADKLVIRKTDLNDSRKNGLHLTALGERTAHLLRDVIDDAEHVLSALFEEIGGNLIELIQAAETQLLDRPLPGRFRSIKRVES